MTDKYEEFKKWCENHNIIIWSVNSISYHKESIEVDSENIFDVFEEEQVEKEKEKRIKRILFRNLDKFHFKSGSLNPHNQQVMRMNFVNSVCNELKEKEYLK